MVVSWLSIQFPTSPSSLIFCRARLDGVCVYGLLVRHLSSVSSTPPRLLYSTYLCTQCDLSFTRLLRMATRYWTGHVKRSNSKVAVSAFKCGLLAFSTYRVGGALLARPVHGSLATELTSSLSFADCNAPGLQLAHDCCL